MNIGKIIKITDTNIYVGFNDGTTKEFTHSSLDSEFTIGEIVEVYGDIIIKSSTLHSTKKLRQNSPIVQSTPKNKSKFLRYSILSALSILVVFSIFYLVTFNHVDSTKGFKTIDNYLRARGLTVQGYGKVMSEPEESVNYVTFQIGELDEFIFNSNANNIFNKEHTNLVTATVKIPKSKYLSDVHKDDIIGINGKTSQQQIEEIIIDNYYTAKNINNSTSSSSADDSSSELSTTEKNKSDYIPVNFEKWSNNEIPNGTQAKVKGKVLQEVKRFASRTLKIAVDNDENKILLVTIFDVNYEEPIHLGDQITLYGNTGGLSDDNESLTEGIELPKPVPFMIGFIYEN